jgi:NADH dehydrogenase/NADH:ubiquinone oxidoreductase subunit G
MELVNIVIDGVAQKAPKGMMLLEYCIRNGISVPYFCYHSKLRVFAGCRQCLVKVGQLRVVEKDGRKAEQVSWLPKLAPSCSTPIAEGLNVITNDAEVRDAQRRNLELLLINHPLECPTCDKGGECDLQDWTYAYGPPVGRTTEPKRVRPDSMISEFIRMNYKRCIQCKRCVTFCEDISGDGLLQFAYRGYQMIVYTYKKDRRRSKFSGNTVDLCPVGALTSLPFRFKARPWEIMEAKSVCNQCAVGCNLRLHSRVGQGYNAAYAPCFDAGGKGPDVWRKLARIHRVLPRENEVVNHGWICDKGRFAYEYIHSDRRLTKPLLMKDGKVDGVAWSDAMTYVAGKVKDGVAAAGPDSVALLAGSRLTNEDYFAITDFMTRVVGSGSYELGDAYISDLKHSPGSLAAVVNESSDYETIYGSDLVLTVGVDLREEAPILAISIERHLRERAGMQAACLSPYPTEFAERMGCEVLYEPEKLEAALAKLAEGVAKGADETLAKRILAAKSVAILYGGQIWQSGRVAAAIGKLIELKNAITKAIPGAVVTLTPVFRDANTWGTIILDYFTRIKPGKKAPSYGEILERAAAGGIKVLFVVGQNPLIHFHDHALVERALAAVETVVVTDLFVTETGALATVVFPARSFAEKDGTYFNLEKRLQRITKAPVEIVGPNDDIGILHRLARALGAEDPYTEAKDLFPNMVAAVEPLAGLKFEAIPDMGFVAKFGVPTAPIDTRPVPSGADGGEGLKLLVRHYLFNHETMARNSETWATAVRQPGIFVNTDDLAALGVEDGAFVKATTERGSAGLTLFADECCPRGCAFVSDTLPNGTPNLLTDWTSDVIRVRIERA